MRVIDDKELSKGEGKRQGVDLFIVDNSDANWKAKDYLREWTEIAHTFDIATGYFEIGALLALDGQWQKLDKLRILMGDEVSKRTRKALLAGVETVTRLLDASIENEKEKNDFLSGVPVIVEALRSKQIECRVYAKEKFHAKAYITHSNLSVVGSSALVGSSSFTLPGLTDNVELNIQLRREVEILQEWYERHWDVAEDITPNILQVVERHTREYRPFDVYAKALQEYFRGHEMSVGEWELTRSRLYKKLDQYQKEGYQALMKIVRQQEVQHGHGGAFLCDGAGLGKTFIGMMVIERLVEHERKRVALFVPKAARVAVWSKALRDYLPGISGVFGNLEVFNHTDLYRTNEEIQTRLAQVKERADVIVIDEAHHFRNPGIRAYVKESQRQHGGSQAMSPQREDPKVAEYSVKKTYGKLLKMIETAFSKEKPLFSLAIYDPSPYFKGTGEIDAFVDDRSRWSPSFARSFSNALRVPHALSSCRARRRTENSSRLPLNTHSRRAKSPKWSASRHSMQSRPITCESFRPDSSMTRAI